MQWFIDFLIIAVLNVADKSQEIDFDEFIFNKMTCHALPSLLKNILGIVPKFCF